jgi:hypothetical protein
MNGKSLNTLKQNYTANNIIKAEHQLCTGVGNLRERFTKAYTDLAVALSDPDCDEPEIEELRRYLKGLCGREMAGVTDRDLECAAKCVFELGHSISRNGGFRTE